VAEALVQADVDRGLGLGGPVVAALEDVARTQDGPVRGVATFDVILHRGAEPEVFLQAADAEYDAWARLTRSMREAVAKKSVRIPASADSLQVTVKLDARVQYPDGSDPRKRGPFAKATGLEPGTESIVPKTVPGVTVGVVGKVCGAGLHVGMDGLGILGGCSPENIGTVPLRIVHGVEVSEVAM
jgi:hypothetical protein